MSCDGNQGLQLIMAYKPMPPLITDADDAGGRAGDTAVYG